jgi:hypothetical protein
MASSDMLLEGILPDKATCLQAVEDGFNLGADSIGGTAPGGGGHVDLQEWKREVAWHVYEITHVNVKRTKLLRWPVAGYWIRDQHEINRLVLIALEKMAAALSLLESSMGRHFRKQRQEERGHWVKSYRYLGLRWKQLKPLLLALRADWEAGRSRRFRLRSRLPQVGFNENFETALTCTCELQTTLSGILADISGIPPDHEGGAWNERMASALWHAREGPALRARWERKLKQFQFLIDPQRRLNRLYQIALEDLFVILQMELERVVELGAVTVNNGERPD